MLLSLQNCNTMICATTECPIFYSCHQSADCCYCCCWCTSCCSHYWICFLFFHIQLVKFVSATVAYTDWSHNWFCFCPNNLSSTTATLWLDRFGLNLAFSSSPPPIHEFLRSVDDERIKKYIWPQLRFLFFSLFHQQWESCMQLMMRNQTKRIKKQIWPQSNISSSLLSCHQFSVGEEGINVFSLGPHHQQFVFAERADRFSVDNCGQIWPEFPVVSISSILQTSGKFMCLSSPIKILKSIDSPFCAW